MINLDATPRKPVSQECVEHGRKLKAARWAAKKNMCHIADAAFMRLTTVSEIERGLIHNLHITPEEWVSK